MLVVPPLIPPEQQGEEDLISPYGPQSRAQRGDAVRCPLVRMRLIYEGACYDFQSFAQGAGPIEWQEGTAQLYGKIFHGARKETVRSCIRHQLEIIQADDNDYPAEYELRLRARLREIDGDA